MTPKIAFDSDYYLFKYIDCREYECLIKRFLFISELVIDIYKSQRESCIERIAAPFICKKPCRGYCIWLWLLYISYGFIAGHGIEGLVFNSIFVFGVVF